MKPEPLKNRVIPSYSSALRRERRAPAAPTPRRRARAPLQLAHLVTPLAIALLLLVGTHFAHAAATHVVINEIHFDPPEKKPLEFIELHNASPLAADLAGWELEKFKFPPEATIAPGGFLVVARDPAALAKAFSNLKPLGPLPGKLKHHGEKITLRDAAGRTVDEVRYSAGFPWPTATLATGCSLERIHPSLSGLVPGSWRSSGFTVQGTPKKAGPSPGRQNSVFTTNAPPSISDVQHTPAQPRPGDRVLVTARVSDPAGVREVALHVQSVEPGAYIRKSDPTFETAWKNLPMRDDGTDGDAKAGDGIFTATVPAEWQTHRRLLRYRITATDAPGLSGRVPYADDDCPNFAWFCYGGLPAWTGASQPGKTPPVTFTPEFLGTLPPYHLIANHADVERSQWDGGYHKRKLFGTLVYEGRVYDHIQFHNRGMGSTHVSGKNKWGFHFNRAREFQARDQWGRDYAHNWNNFAMNACASPWVQVNRGLAGLDEAVSFRAYHLAGVPSPATHWVHFRVVSRTNEVSAKSQYEGDLWGLYLAVQDTDGAWLRERGLPDGNTYSAETGRKHLAPGMPANNSDFNNFMSGSRSTREEKWWRENLNLPDYYSFHAINRIVSNVDLRHGANHCLYHAPDGRWSPVPWDLDMMFIPKTHWPGVIDQTRCLDLPVLKREYQNRAREILDLLCSDPAPDGGQFGQLVAECARALRPAGHDRIWPELDMAVWNHHPRTSDKGAFYRNPASQGMMGGGFERRLATPDFAGFCRFLTEFATDSRPTKNYQPNDGDVRGYGYGFLWRESKDDAIPARPTIKEIAAAAKNGAREFETTPFTTATPAAKFAALQWRVGRFTAPGLPGFRDGKPWRYEIEPLWLSDELTVPALRTSIPASVFKSPGTYRVRVRHRDTNGRWSHWSAPAQIAVP